MATGLRGEQIKDETIASVDLASGSIKAGEMHSEAISGQATITSTDTTNDRLLILDATDSALKQVSIGNLGVTAGAAGADGQVQYNNGGSAMGGATGLFWDDSNNRVGVGTPIPSTKLHISSSGNTTLRVQGAPGYYGALNVKGGTGDSAWLWQPANTSNMRLYVGDSDRLHIEGATGNVGIGTTGPDRLLDIFHATEPQLRLTHTDGSKYVDMRGTPAGDFEITGSNANAHLRFISPGHSSILVQSNAVDGDAQIGFSVDAGASIAFSVGVDDGDLDKFKIGGSTIDTGTRLTIDANGFIGVGTESPVVALDVVYDYHNSTFENQLQDGQGGGRIIKYSPGADDTLTVGQLYFLHTDGTWDQVDANAVGDIGNSQLLGVGRGSARNIGVLLEGFVRIPSTEILNVPGSGAVDGLPVYASTTAGHFDFTAPASPGDTVRVVGYAIDDDSGDVMIYFNPSSTWIEL